MENEKKGLLSHIQDGLINTTAFLQNSCKKYFLAIFQLFLEFLVNPNLITPVTLKQYHRYQIYEMRCISSLIVRSASLFHERFFEKNVETLIIEIIDTHKKWILAWFLSSNGKLITTTKISSLWKSLPILIFYPLKIILLFLKTGSFVMLLQWLYTKICLLLF